MNLIRPTQGTAFIFKQDVRRKPSVLKRVGALVEGAAFYGYMSGRNNLRSWFSQQSPAAAPLAGFTAEPGMGISLILLGLWVVGLVALSIIIFQRQDLTE